MAIGLTAEGATPVREWMQKMYSNSYEEHGTKNPRWDGRARGVLALYSELRARTKQSNGEQDDPLVSGLTNVMAAGCTDPVMSGA